MRATPCPSRPALIASALFWSSVLPPAARAQAFSIEPVTTEAHAGEVVAFSGQISPPMAAAGVATVRVFLGDNLGRLLSAADATVSVGGSFQGALRVPEKATPDNYTLLAIGLGDPGEEAAESELAVVWPLPQSLEGALRDGGGAPVGGERVLLIDPRSQVVAEAMSAPDGSYTFPDVAPGTYYVQPVSTGYDYHPRPVAVPSGGGAAQNLGDQLSITPPLLYVEPRVHTVGALIVPSPGSAWTEPHPVMAGFSWTGGGGQLARFDSLAGFGGNTSLMVRFFATAGFPDEAPAADRRVGIYLRNSAGEIVHTSFGVVPAPLYPGVFDYDVYAATENFDLDVAALPPGTYELEVFAHVVGAVNLGEAQREIYTIEVGDIVGRWLNSWVEPADPANPVTIAPGADGPEYTFTGNLPPEDQREFLGLSFDIPVFDIHLENSLSLVAAGLTESYNNLDGYVLDSDPPRFSTGLTLMGQEVLDGSKSYPYLPVKGADGVAGYRLPPTTVIEKEFMTIPLYENGPGIGCVDLLFGQVCAGWKVYVDLTLAGDVKVSSTIGDDLRMAAKFDPGIKGTLGGHVRVKAVVCSASADITGTARVSLPVEYRSGPGGGFDLLGPCVALSGSMGAKVSCLGLGFGAEGSIGPAFFPDGCGEAPSSAAAKSAKGRAPRDGGGMETVPFATEAAPDVHADGAGGAMAVWIADEAPAAGGYQPYVHFSRFSAGNWSAPGRITFAEAIVSDPKVVNLAGGRALAVWVQNEKLIATARNEGFARPDQQELYYSVWDGFGWSVPAALTDNSLADGLPDLAASDDGSEATVVWTRTLNSGGAPLPAALGARFDGADWGQEELISTDATKFATDVRAAYDAAGDRLAVWTSDSDRDLTSYRDREIAFARDSGAGWGAPQTVPGAPDGAFAPDVAGGHEGALLIAFSEPPAIGSGAGAEMTSGYGNKSRLWTASFDTAAGWILEEAKSGTYAEFADLEWKASAGPPRLFFRGFAHEQVAHQYGDLTVLVGDLRESGGFDWDGDFLTHDNQTNWMVCASVDPNTGDNFFFSVKQDPLGAALDPAAIAEGARLGRQLPPDLLFATAPGGASLAGHCLSFDVDAAIAPGDVVFSDPDPQPGDSILISVRVTNEGLASAAGYEFRLTGTRPLAPGVDFTFIDTTFDDLGGFGSERWVPFGYNVPADDAPLTFRVEPTFGGIDVSNQDNNAMETEAPSPVAPVSGLVAVFDPEEGVVHLAWEPSPSAGVEDVLVGRREVDLPGAAFEPLGLVLPGDSSFVDILAVPGARYAYQVVPQAGDRKPLDRLNPTAEIEVPAVAPAWSPPPLRVDVANGLIFLEMAKRQRWPAPSALQRSATLAGDWQDVATPPVELANGYRWVLPLGDGGAEFFRARW